MDSLYKTTREMKVISSAIELGKPSEEFVLREANEEGGHLRHFKGL